MNNFTLNGQPLFGTATNSSWYDFGGGIRQYPDYCTMGGFLGLSTGFSWELKDVPLGWPRSYGSYGYPENVYSLALPEWNGSPNGAPTINVNNPVNFSGGDLTVEIQDYNTGTVIQKVTVNIPSATLTFPMGSLNTLTGGSDTETEWAAWYRSILYSYYIFIDSTYQIVRSVILKSDSKARGDFRILAGRRGVSSSDEIDSNFFEAPTMNVSGENQHDFKSPLTFEGNAVPSIISQAFYLGSSDFLYSGNGRLVSNANYNISNPYSVLYRPQVNANMNGATMNEGYPGDWDTGVSNFGDGAYINKPDESVFIKADSSNNASNTYTVDQTPRGLHYLRWYGNSMRMR